MCDRNDERGEAVADDTVLAQVVAVGEATGDSRYRFDTREVDVHDFLDRVEQHRVSG